MESLYKKYREIILYIFFGGLTTLINIVCYAISTRLFNLNEIISTIIAFFLSVLFAYITNRKWVFQSKTTGIKSIVREAISFFGGRIFSFTLDVLNMYLFVSLLNFNDLLIKILSNIVVIILNFIISKLIVFRKKI